METTVERSGKHGVKLTVEVPADEVARDLDRAYRKVGQQVRVPGFRKGHVPRKIIDAQIGREAVLDEFVQESLPTYYGRAVREHELAPITDPDINIEQVEEGKPLIFTATVEVRPRLELDDYKSIRVPMPEAEVTERDVDEFVDRLRERFAELESVSHPARRGDYVIADIRASLHGAEIDELTATDQLYEVGSEAIVPELDTELENKRKGEILKFNATLPEAAGDRAGQEVTFQVLVKEVKAKRLPALDDEFAKSASEFDTLEELRADLRTKLADVKQRAAAGRAGRADAGRRAAGAGLGRAAVPFGRPGPRHPGHQGRPGAGGGGPAGGHQGQRRGAAGGRRRPGAGARTRAQGRREDPGTDRTSHVTGR